METMGKKQARRPRRSFTPEFKAEIVELCQRGDRSIGQVARDFDLTDTAVREWVKQAERDTGVRADGLTSIKPPSTTNDAPVVHAASGEQSHAMQLAISRASPGRGIGNAGFPWSVGSSSSRCVIGVATMPGATELTVIPCRPSSSASCFVSPPSPCLATV